MDRNIANVPRGMMKGAALVAMTRLLLRLLSLGSLLVLARLLTPTDYGIVAMALTIQALLYTLSEMGVQQALLSIPTVSDEHLHTAFTLALLRGVMIAALLFCAAGPAAVLMEQPALIDVLRVLALSAFIEGLRNPGFILFRRRLDLSKETSRLAASTVVGTAATITAAFWLRNYWAIVIGSLAMRMTDMASTYWRVSYRPRLGLTHWRDFFAFGGWLTGSSIMTYLSSNAPQYLIGKMFGAPPLGVYTIGRDLSGIATRELALPLATVILPGLAAVGQDPQRLRRAYREVQSVIFGMAFPIGLGSAMLAHEVVLLLAGAKWLQAVFVVQVLAPATALTMLNAGTNGLAMLKSRTRDVFERASIGAILAYPLLFTGGLIGGFGGLVVAIGIQLSAQTAVTAYYSTRLTGDSPLAPLIGCWRSIIAGAAMCAALSFANPGVAGDVTVQELIVHTLPLVLLGVLVYATVHAGLWLLLGRPPGFERRLIEFATLARAARR